MSFTSQFLKECIGKNITSGPDICAEAQRQILELDEEVKKITEIKSKQDKLKLVIKQFGKNINQRPINVINTNISKSELDAPTLQVCMKIVSKIENNGKFECNDLFSEHPSIERKIVFFSLKWLHDNEIITRNNNVYNKGNKFSSFMKKDNNDN